MKPLSFKRHRFPAEVTHFIDHEVTAFSPSDPTWRDTDLDCVVEAGDYGASLGSSMIVCKSLVHIKGECFLGTLARGSFTDGKRTFSTAALSQNQP
jgi:hypothetical protein